MKKIPTAILIPLILIIAIAIAVSIVKTAPKPERKPKGFQAPLVEVLDNKNLISDRPQWQTSGQLVSSDQAELAPQVSGRVVAVNPKATIGAELNKGEWLIKIEAIDYQVALNQAKAQVAQAKADLTIEKGKQSLAKEEYELSRTEGEAELSEEDLALVLRKPYLQKAEAVLLSAKAQLAKAQANMQRTKLSMPFAGKITQRSVSLGQYIQAGKNIFEIINPNVYWIEVTVATRFLQVIDEAQPVQVMTSANAQPLEAKIVNVNAKLDAQNRQAVVLLEVSPQNGEKVFVNDFADIILIGKELPNTIKVPQKLLLADDKLWLVENNELTSITANVLYRGQGSVWIENTLAGNQSVLTTPISYATEGMKVKLPSVEEGEK